MNELCLAPIDGRVHWCSISDIRLVLPHAAVNYEIDLFYKNFFLNHAT